MTCESRLSIVSALCGQLLDAALETAVTSRVKMKTDIRLQSAIITAHHTSKSWSTLLLIGLSVNRGVIA